jgi:hypothetical protein
MMTTYVCITMGDMDAESSAKGLVVNIMTPPNAGSFPACLRQGAARPLRPRAPISDEPVSALMAIA